MVKVLGVLLLLAATACSHQQPLSRADIPDRVPEDAPRPRFPSPEPPVEPDAGAMAAMDAADAVDSAEDAVSLPQTRSDGHCPFGEPVPNLEIDFGPTESVWRQGYELLHSADTKTPYWVCETYTRRSLIKNHERGSLGFKADPELRLAHARPRDYRGSSQYQIDIGHMAPAESHSSTEQRLRDTFYLSNGVPQNLSLNRGAWAQIEECARLSTPPGGTTWVISGPMHYWENDEEPEYIGHGVLIPTHTWKVVVVQRGDATLRAWAVVTPNQKPPEGWKLGDFRASIDDIELATGFDFMPELSERMEEQLERIAHDVTCVE